MAATSDGATLKIAAVMAGFKTHITVSSLLGAGYGGAAYWMYGVPWPTCVLAGGLCSVSGMLPDLDSDSGTPLRESMAFAAAVVPMMLLHRFQRMGMSHELMILAAAATYLLVRFGGAALLKHCTVHRGMFHSLPAAAIFGEIAFLLAAGDDLGLRTYNAGAVVLGYLSHLVLDELRIVIGGVPVEAFLRHRLEAVRPKSLGQSVDLRQAGGPDRDHSLRTARAGPVAQTPSRPAACHMPYGPPPAAR